jgi:hypothetical protein
MPMRLTKPVHRVVLSLRHGLLVVSIAEEGIYYREKGRKKSFLIPHGVAFQNAVNLHLARERDAKKQARASRKKERR